MKLEFKNYDLYNLITKDQLNSPGVVAIVVENETDIPAVVKWVPRAITAENTAAYSAVLQIKKMVPETIKEVINNTPPRHKPDVVIVHGSLADEVRVIELHELSTAIRKPIILVADKESMIRSAKSSPEGKRYPPDMVLATCVTQAFVDDGKVFLLRSLRNIVTPSGYEVIL